MPRPKKPPNSYPKSNRVDLNQAQAPVPVVAPNSTTYGERQQIEQSVQEAPLATGGGGATLEDVLQKAMGAAPPPGGGLTRPTARPMEPVTHGLPSGPGMGSEALIGKQGATPKVSDTYDALYGETNNIAFLRMAEQARAMNL